MRIFLDTNILIDLLGDREEFTLQAQKLMSNAISNGDTLLLTDLSVVNACYIQRKSLSSKGFVEAFTTIRKYFEIVSIGAAVVDSALVAMWKDFEDSLQYYAAINAQADVIVTRNKKDFRVEDIDVFTPKELIERWEIIDE